MKPGPKRKAKTLSHQILVICRRDKRASLERLCAMLAQRYNHREVKEEVTRMLKMGELTVKVTVSYWPARQLTAKSDEFHD